MANKQKNWNDLPAEERARIAAEFQDHWNNLKPEQIAKTVKELEGRVKVVGGQLDRYCYIKNGKVVKRRNLTKEGKTPFMNEMYIEGLKEKAKALEETLSVANNRLIEQMEFSSPYSQAFWAEMFGVTEKTIYRWFKAKKYHAVQVSDRKWKIPWFEIPADAKQKIVNEGYAKEFFKKITPKKRMKE